MAKIFLVALGLLVQGCATLHPPGQVTVNLVTFRPLEVALLETSLEVTLRMTNESPEPLRLRASTHRLYVNETYVGRGVTGAATALPPFGSQTQNVTFHLENLALLRKAQALGNTTLVKYRLQRTARRRFKPPDHEREHGRTRFRTPAARSAAIARAG